MIDLTLCMLGNLLLFLSIADIFKIYIFKKFFQECYQRVKQFDLDQVRLFVRLDVGLNCLQIQQTKKVFTSRQI